MKSIDADSLRCCTNKVFTGSAKYGHYEPSHTDKKKKIWPHVRWQQSPSLKSERWVPSLPGDEPHKRTIVAFGDGDFPTSFRGKKTGAYKVIKRALFRLQATVPGVRILMVPEYRSSQICSKCNTRSLEKMKHNGLSLHAVVKCKNCSTVWNRDINASRNLFHIAVHCASHQDQVPPAFRRPND